MKSITIVPIICIIVSFNCFTQTNIRTRSSAPTNFPDVFDENAISNAIRSRSNSFNSSADNIQNRINQTSEKLQNLQYVDKKRYNELQESINSFTKFLNESRIDLSNSTNKQYVNNCLSEINNTIDTAFRYKAESFKIPVWLNEKERGWNKNYIFSEPE